MDSILCDRSENENGAARRVKTEFLLQFDGCTTSLEEKVLVLAATNRPQELDDGVLRRFTQKIFIDLPDAETRIILIQKTFKKHNTPVNLRDWKYVLLILFKFLYLILQINRRKDGKLFFFGYFSDL